MTMWRRSAGCIGSGGSPAGLTAEGPILAFALGRDASVPAVASGKVDWLIGEALSVRRRAAAPRDGTGADPHLAFEPRGSVPACCPITRSGRRAIRPPAARVSLRRLVSRAP